MLGKEKTLMSNKHKERHLIPSVTEMKIRSAMKCLFTPISMAKKKKKSLIINVGGDVGFGDSHILIVGCKSVQPWMDTVKLFPTCRCSNSTTHRSEKCIHTHKDLYTRIFTAQCLQ